MKRFATTDQPSPSLGVGASSRETTARLLLFLAARQDPALRAVDAA